MKILLQSNILKIAFIIFSLCIFATHTAVSQVTYKKLTEFDLPNFQEAKPLVSETGEQPEVPTFDRFLKIDLQCFTEIQNFDNIKVEHYFDFGNGLFKVAPLQHLPYQIEQWKITENEFFALVSEIAIHYFIVRENGCEFVIQIATNQKPIGQARFKNCEN